MRCSGGRPVGFRGSTPGSLWIHGGGHPPHPRPSRPPSGPGGSARCYWCPSGDPCQRASGSRSDPGNLAGRRRSDLGGRPPDKSPSHPWSHGRKRDLCSGTEGSILRGHDLSGRPRSHMEPRGVSGDPEEPRVQDLQPAGKCGFTAWTRRSHQCGRIQEGVHRVPLPRPREGLWGEVRWDGV